MTPALNISVVIRTYTENRWHYLVDSVNSVLSQTLPPMEIVLVVDHNPNLMERVCTQWLSSIVAAVENRGARGSSGAWNSGIAVAKGDIIAFLDDDAVAAPDWLEQLTSGYEQKEVVGIGGTIKPNWLDGRPGWFPEEFGWVVGCTYRGLPETVAPVRNLIGCNMSFRVQVLKALGGFLEEKGLGHMGGTPVGCDETELCIRLHQHWPQVILLHKPQAIVYHNVPVTRSKWSYFRSRCFLEGQSKAMVSHLVGVGDGLASERVHTFRALPQGIMQGVTDAFLRRDLTGFGRAAAIVAGLAIATTGFLLRKARLLGESSANQPSVRSAVSD